MFKEYIQTTYTSQIDKNIIRTENKIAENPLDPAVCINMHPFLM
jgi:hypothetical protein